MTDLQEAFDHPYFVPFLVVAVSLGALGMALASQYWGGLEPCVLCMYQRYAFVAAAALGLAGIAAGRRSKPRRLMLVLAGFAFLSGAAIAAFHVGVEQRWWQGTAECRAPAFDPNASIDDMRKQLLNTRFVPCDEVAWSLFGISIAGYNVLASLGLAVLTFWSAACITIRRRR